jgi:hypothetical protein
MIAGLSRFRFFAGRTGRLRRPPGRAARRTLLSMDLHELHGEKPLIVAWEIRRLRGRETGALRTRLARAMALVMQFLSVP